MKRFYTVATAILLATLLGRLDDGFRSLADVFRLQNIPALLIYGLLFYALAKLAAVVHGRVARWDAGSR